MVGEAGAWTLSSQAHYEEGMRLLKTAESNTSGEGLTSAVCAAVHMLAYVGRSLQEADVAMQEQADAVADRIRTLGDSVSAGPGQHQRPEWFHQAR